MNWVFGSIIIVSALYSLLLGTTAQLCTAALASGYSAVTLCLELCGTVAMWCGVMRIAEKSGLCDKISRLLSPITSFLFPGLRGKSPHAIDSISLNITANILGLGAAATPMALDAMAELDRLNGASAVASNYMVVFVVLNTASFQLIPTTVATIRSLAGSTSPLDILPSVWISSAAGVLCAVFAAKAFARRKGDDGNE
ncbi:MAG: nucleoside recognition domain-containing protein [Oscillospiraceae bacterium]